MKEIGFLTLARSSGESLLITTPYGEELTIHFHSFQSKHCKVSIECPKQTQIMRTELVGRESYVSREE